MPNINAVFQRSRDLVRNVWEIQNSTGHKKKKSGQEGGTLEDNAEPMASKGLYAFGKRYRASSKYQVPLESREVEN